MPCCCAYNCCKKREDGYAVFAIPQGKRDVLRKKQWLHNIGRKNFVPTKNSVVCELHFTEDQFEPRILREFGKKKLKPNAVPTIFSHRPVVKHRKPPRQRHEPGTDSKPVATACLPAIYDASALGPPASPSELCLGETLPAADGVKAQTVRVHRTGRSWPLVMCPHHSTSEAEALGVATADFSAVFPDIDFKQAAEVACDKPPFIEDSLVSTTCRVEPWRGLQDKCVGEYEAVLQHAERFCQTEHHITLVQCRKPQVSTCSVEVQADPWCQHHCGIGPIGVDLCET
ncbi:uncharacterized protein LOC119453068 isoform X13 [Dermacentor silvarum]|uniref:uncharacterized protein LOC119453068 isoform X13 n=1 Tax=Dermacentor silvarum TaxID=543639 RepID=UPI002101A7D6|nr:uncharacterized protein LOC119453068 isoform X13 [Dermacentor silvarum]